MDGDIMTPNSSSIRRVKQNSQEKGKLKIYVNEVSYLAVCLKRVLKAAQYSWFKEGKEVSSFHRIGYSTFNRFMGVWHIKIDCVAHWNVYLKML